MKQLDDTGSDSSEKRALDVLDTELKEDDLDPNLKSQGKSHKGNTL